MSYHQPLKDTRGKGEPTVAVCEGGGTKTQWEITGALYLGPTLSECLGEATTTGQTIPFAFQTNSVVSSGCTEPSVPPC